MTYEISVTTKIYLQNNNNSISNKFITSGCIINYYQTAKEVKQLHVYLVFLENKTQLYINCKR